MAANANANANPNPNAGIIQKADAEKKAVAEKKNTMRDYVRSMESEIAKALPSVITPERFTRITLSTLSANPSLQKCTPQSFLASMMTAAQLGLEPNTPLGQAYLLPYKNKGTLECSFQIGYKGLLDLAYRSGEISVVQAHTVYEKDTFEYEFGLEAKLVHKPYMGADRGNPIAYYAMFKTKDGGYGFDVMSVDDIRAHAKKYSKAYSTGFSPWTTNFDEMAKKGLALDTEIPTPTGWTTMEQLHVGDEVFDMNGKPTKVIAVSEIKHLPCFKVTFSNGGEIICDDEHRWLASIGKNARRSIRETGWKTMTVNELFEAKAAVKHIVVPVPGQIDLPDAELPIDPWLLGYWLGDGHSHNSQISCNEDWCDEVADKINTTTPYKVINITHDKRSKAVVINIRDGFKVALRELGVLDNKHVPSIYLRGSTKQRLALLQGLMDSDGTVYKARGRVKFCSTNKSLRDAVFELATSLGEVCNKHEYINKGFGKEVIAYWVEWKPSTCVPVTLKHHLEKLKDRIVIPYLSIKSIEKIESVPTKCIAVESDTKTYLCGRGFYVTHNTVLKRVLKYAPLKSEFVRKLASDDTIKTEIGQDMTEISGQIIDYSETIDPETGEIVSEGQVQ